MKARTRVEVLAFFHAHGLPKAEPEYKFWVGRQYAFDFAWIKEQVALEVEGGLFGFGKKCPVCGRRRVAGHSSIERIKTDVEKYSAAAVLGWRVLRCFPQDLTSGAVIPLLEMALGLKESTIRGTDRSGAAVLFS